MTTSKTLHNHLVSLSRKKSHSSSAAAAKYGGRLRNMNPCRMVELARIVFSSPPTTTTTTTITTFNHHKDDEPDITTTTTDTIAAVKDEHNNTNDMTDEHDLHDTTYYTQLHQQLALELEQLQQRRIQVQQRQVDFWGIYKYALEKVSNLNDLRDAPDAILPGNFPEPVQESTGTAAPATAAAVPETEATRI